MLVSLHLQLNLPTFTFLVSCIICGVFRGMIMRYVCAQQAGTGLIFEFRSLFSLYYFPLLIHSTVFQVDFTHVWALANGPDCGDLEEKAGDC